jgi:Phage terminase large subunit (GpA)
MPSRVAPRGAQDPFRRGRHAHAQAPLELYPSEWAEHFIRIKDGDTGKVNAMSFAERRYLLRAYNTPARRVLFITSRQTEKSTTLANLLLSRLGLHAGRTSLFVSPSAMQTKVFSTARIDETITVSPLLGAMTHQSMRMNILEKEFINRSRLYLRYAFLSADRIRGLSSNDVFIDELQDVVQDLLPVIEEVASHHQDSTYCYSGTPKSLDNTIEVYWSKHSTQSEFVIPCERHGTPKRKDTWYWNVLGVRNIGRTGPVCEACHKPISPQHPDACWVEMNPGAEIEGLRICRLMVPWFQNEAKWKEILQAQERYPQAQFDNEVLALSSDSGTKPLTRMEVIRACDPRYRVDNEDLVAELGRTHSLYAGIDWSGGGNSLQSAYTVLFVGGYVRGDARFQIVFGKRFTGPLADPDAQMSELKRLLKRFNIRLIGTDFGGGFFPNKNLTNVFGPARVHPMQYIGKSVHKMAYKPQLHRHLLFRSMVMADVFQAVKKRQIAFPRWEGFREPFASDMLAIRQEYNEQQRIIQFIKTRGATDDSFHALLYCLLASAMEVPRPDIFAPIRDPSLVTEGHSEEQLRIELEALSDEPESSDY